jgi:hypothetical protein
MYEYIFVYIVLPLIIIIKIIDFFVGNIFSHILVSSLYANFETPVCNKICQAMYFKLLWVGFVLF